jgi:hypothetical protein
MLRLGKLIPRIPLVLPVVFAKPGQLRLRTAMLLCWFALLSAEACRADALARYVGHWEGTRTYNLPRLQGTESFQMTVSRFRKQGLKVESVIQRPGWPVVQTREVFYPRGTMKGVSGVVDQIHSVSDGRWTSKKSRLRWNWKMYYSNLEEWTKQSTTWRIDADGRLRELRVVPKQRNSGAGRITAVASKVR